MVADNLAGVYFMGYEGRSDRRLSVLLVLKGKAVVLT
jgi:hypothetical protein